MATKEEIDKVLILATGKTGQHLDAFKKELSELGVVIKVDEDMPDSGLYLSVKPLI